MRIATTYENGDIFQHFGKSQQFKLYDVEQGKIVYTAMLPVTNGGHGALVGLLQEARVDAVICGGMGLGAQQALADANIKVYAGVTGATDDAVQAYLAGTLQYTTEATCQDHHHHDGHDCGGHH